MDYLLTFVMRDGRRYSTKHSAESRKAALDFGLARWREQSGVVRIGTPSYDTAFLCADIVELEVSEYE